MIPVTNTKLAIGIPLSWPYVSSAFFDSFMMLEKSTFYPIRRTSGPIDEMRNEIVEAALQIEATHLLMLDADMTFPKELITKMLSHNYEGIGAIGALCFMRYPPFTPVLRVGEPGAYINLDPEEHPDDSILEVDATGTAILCFNMEVFKKIPKPWFEFTTFPNELYYGSIGEDIAFCWKMRQAGYKILVDTSIKCGHLALMEIDMNAFKLWKELQKVKERVANKERGGGIE